MIDAGFLIEDESHSWGSTLSADQKRKGDRLIAAAIQALAEEGARS